MDVLGVRLAIARALYRVADRLRPDERELCFYCAREAALPGGMLGAKCMANDRVQI